MPRPSYITLELMIDKVSEFIEWLFGKKRKSESDKINELNLILKSQLNLSIFDFSESSFETLKIKLEKADSILLENIISALFKISTSKNKKQTFQKLKCDIKLNERIMELILYTENRYNKLSLESFNIKNSLKQMLKLVV